jgi:hypothetical protein
VPMKRSLGRIVKIAVVVVAFILVNTVVIIVVDAEPIHDDILVVLNVTGGVIPGGASWADSYSVGDQCYCRTTFDHNIGNFFVETPSLGWLTTRQICTMLGEGPSVNDNTRPVYNDLQCGNGPPNDAGDEHVCPGRTDIGPEGCGHIGPRWNFGNLTNNNNDTIVLPIRPVDAHPDIVVVVNVTGWIDPTVEMAESYSVQGRCYCMSTLNNGIGEYFVQTLIGWNTVNEICRFLGHGPEQGRVYYNDVQCGNGPPSAAGDEHSCPGRVDMGSSGCGHIGPRWNFEQIQANETAAPSGNSTLGFPSNNPSAAPSVALSFLVTNNTTTLLSSHPSIAPNEMPLITPSMLPSNLPSTLSTEGPILLPTPERPSVTMSPFNHTSSKFPSDNPSSMPSVPPSFLATNKTTTLLSSHPSVALIETPSVLPSNLPSKLSTEEPILLPIPNSPSVAAVSDVAPFSSDGDRIFQAISLLNSFAPHVLLIFL